VSTRLGVLARWRDRLPVTPRTPALTLGEGDTPLVSAPALARDVRQRRKQRRETLLLVVGGEHEHVRGHQYAPRPAKTTGNVWQRIFRSHQTDQLVT